MATTGLRGAAGVLWLFALPLVGCAFTPVPVRTPNHPDVATGSRRGEGRSIVLVTPFHGARSQDRCGMQKNGYNMDTAAVICQRAPEVMLAEVLHRELAAAGFLVLPGPRQAGPTTIVITGSVLQLFAEPKLNFLSSVVETDVALRLTATTSTGLLAHRTFYVKGEEAAFFTGPDNMQRSLNSGIRQLLAAVVGAVANLADSFPAAPAAVVATKAGPETLEAGARP